MNLRSIISCTLTNYRKWLVDPKMYTLIVLMIVFSIWNFSGIYDYAKVVGFGVSPWIFSHILIFPIAMPIYGSFAVLLFSNAPFIDKHTPFLMIRTGRISWLIGQLIYIVFTSILYTVFHFVISVVTFFPRIEFTADWGKVLRTLAMNPSSLREKGLYSTVFIQNNIVSSFSAIEATLISLGLFCLVTIFIGIIIFSLNIIIGRMAGLIFAGILVFISYFSIFVGTFSIGYKVYYFSPLSWSSLQYIDWHGSGDSPSFLYAITFLLVASVILSLLSVISFSKNDINVAEGIE